ncbi:MAG: hypothetical protein ABIF10_00240 [Candidatus Woesearchaeota archaeon]
MKIWKSQGTRGFESVLTTFVFIAVAIVLLVGINQFISMVAVMRAKAADDMNVNFVAHAARNRLLFCYGEHFESLENDCLVNGILGYEISREEYGGCQQALLKSSGLNVGANKAVYYVPVYDRTSDRTCLGKVVIYI